MKKSFLLPTLAILGLLFIQGTSKTDAVSEYELHALAPDMPANVKAVVEQKCYGCHNAESKNEKGKAKLDWDAFEETKKSKQMATMAKRLLQTCPVDDAREGGHHISAKGPPVPGRPPTHGAVCRIPRQRCHRSGMRALTRNGPPGQRVGVWPQPAPSSALGLRTRGRPAPSTPNTSGP